jgi:hypothetical protein
VAQLGIRAAFYLTLGLGVSREVMGYGALSYTLGAVGFTGLLYSGLVVPVLHKHLTRSWLAIAQGLVSAISERGAAALFFLFVVPKLALTELTGFGAAAGIIEALVIPLMSIVGISVLGGTPVEKHAAEQQAQDLNASPGAVMILPVVERGVTMTLHIASRTLVYAATFLGDVGQVLCDKKGTLFAKSSVDRTLVGDANCQMSLNSVFGTDAFQALNRGGIQRPSVFSCDIQTTSKSIGVVVVGNPDRIRKGTLQVSNKSVEFEFRLGPARDEHLIRPTLSRRLPGKNTAG